MSKLEEIKALSDDELGWQVAKSAGLTVLNRNAQGRKGYVTKIYNDMVLTNGLCESLDLIAEVEKIVIEKAGYSVYGFYLKQVLFDGWTGNIQTQEENARFALATARQRAESCLLALQSI